MNYSPSVYAHAISGGVLVAGIIYLALNILKIVSRDPYQIVVLLLLVSIAISIHGISHIGLESVYNYNPLSIFTGKQVEAYHPIDCPCRRHRNCPYFKN
jgi:hypothetical protein